MGPPPPSRLSAQCPPYDRGYPRAWGRSVPELWRARVPHQQPIRPRQQGCPPREANPPLSTTPGLPPWWSPCPLLPLWVLLLWGPRRSGSHRTDPLGRAHVTEHNSLRVHPCQDFSPSFVWLNTGPQCGRTKYGSSPPQEEDTRLPCRLRTGDRRSRASYKAGTATAAKPRQLCRSARQLLRTPTRGRKPALPTDTGTPAAALSLARASLRPQTEHTGSSCHSQRPRGSK